MYVGLVRWILRCLSHPRQNRERPTRPLTNTMVLKFCWNRVGIELSFYLILFSTLTWWTIHYHVVNFIEILAVVINDSVAELSCSMLTCTVLGFLVNHLAENNSSFLQSQMIIFRWSTWYFSVLGLILFRKLFSLEDSSFTRLLSLIILSASECRIINLLSYLATLRSGKNINR